MRFILIVNIILSIVVLYLNAINPQVFPSTSDNLMSFVSQGSLDAISSNATTEVQINSELYDATTKIKNPSNSAVAGILSFIDTVSPLIDLISFLLGLNFISLMYSLNLPIVIILLVGVPFTILYLIGLVQFFRNGFIPQ